MLRKPDNYRVNLPWNSKFKPKLIGRPSSWKKHRKHVLKNGLADHLFDWEGIEQEIDRVAKLMDELE